MLDRFDGLLGSAHRDEQIGHRPHQAEHVGRCLEGSTVALQGQLQVGGLLREHTKGGGEDRLGLDILANRGILELVGEGGGEIMDRGGFPAQVEQAEKSPVQARTLLEGLDEGLGRLPVPPNLVQDLAPTDEEVRALELAA